MRKGLKVSLAYITAVLMLVAFTGCGTQTAGSSSAIGVKISAAEKKALKTNLDVTGVLVPQQTVNIASKISGQATNVGFDVGHAVKAGDTLATLETKTLNAQLQQAQAALEAAEAGAQSVKSQADQAKINLDSVTKAYERTKSMFEAGGASQSQMDDATSNLDIAKKQYETAAGSSQNQAQASISTAQANINNIKVQLENAVITSPINGIITNRNINSGEVASPGTVLLTIVDTSSLKLKSTVAQEALPLIKEGQELDVSVDIYHDKVFKGQIGSIGPMAVGTGAYFPIEIDVKNTGDLKAGLSSHASIGISSEEGLVVPSEAVVQNNGQNYVFVIKDKVAAKKVVTTGLKNDKETQIIKGIEAGDQVAVTNVNSLFENMPVNVN